MSSVPPDPSAEPTSAPDDTAAFSRFYLGESDGSRAKDGGGDAHGVLYRIFVGWWRDR